MGSNWNGDSQLLCYSVNENILLNLNVTTKLIFIFFMPEALNNKWLLFFWYVNLIRSSNVFFVCFLQRSKAEWFHHKLSHISLIKPNFISSCKFLCAKQSKETNEKQEHEGFSWPRILRSLQNVQAGERIWITGSLFSYTDENQDYYTRKFVKGVAIWICMSEIRIMDVWFCGIGR